MQLVFLQASTPLTKTFAKLPDGTITKTPYPMTWEFTSITENARNLLDMEALLIKHAHAGNCLLKGMIQRPLIKESRAGSTDSNGTTEFVVLDIDGLPDTGAVPQATLSTFLEAIGLRDVSYVVQWSASYGIENKKLRCHVFMQLDKPVAAQLLKQWLIHLNHTTVMLNSALTLTKTGNSLHWALDISACQNDKLIYIAPPVLKGIRDPMLKQARIQYIRCKQDKLSIAGSFNTEKNKEMTSKKVLELRDSAGLPKRKFTTKMHGMHEIMLKPDACTITEMKAERGFVYFNLNGGDSWAYYHPENQPDFILNFKGEPAYMTKELLPEYWTQLTQQSVRTSSNGISYLAFCDRKTSSYWRGTYDAVADVLDLDVAKNESMLRSFAKQSGLPLGDFIPEWRLVFDPTDNVRVDFTNKVVNQFAPTEFMKAVPKNVKTVPKNIYKVLWNALGSDQKSYDHFINWLSYIIQFRDRTRTAWVLHGTEGTGKGIMVNNILRPIFGSKHTAMRRMEELNEQYNHFMMNSFIVFVDEVQTKALNNERGAMAKLRNFITDENVPIRAMYQNATEVRNYTNWIFASNMADPIAIPKNDRRFNVAKYQPNKLVITDAEIDAIDDELQAFHDYLYNYACDKQAASTPLDSTDRNTMISISESSIDTVGSAILDGNLEFFIDQLPAGQAYSSDPMQQNRVADYKAVLITIMGRTDMAKMAVSISREELRTLFEFSIGNIPNTPNKFTSLLKHHRIHMTKVWVDNKAVAGVKITWRAADTPPAVWQSHQDTLVPPTITTPARKLKAVK